MDPLGGGLEVLVGIGIGSLERLRSECIVVSSQDVRGVALGLEDAFVVDEGVLAIDSETGVPALLAATGAWPLIGVQPGNVAHDNGAHA